MNYYIRFTEITDCEILGMIHSEAWRKAYKGIVPDSILDRMSKEKCEERLYDSFSKGIRNNVIIFKDNEPAGFMYLGKCRDKDLSEEYGEIWGIYLHPKYWRKGIGTKLIDWGIDYLRTEGYKKVSLWVLEENINARKFYEKLGFIHDGTVKELDFGKPLNEFRYLIDI